MPLSLNPLRLALLVLLPSLLGAASGPQQTGQKFLPEGQFVWHEIKSANPEASAKFYTSVFNWKLLPAPVASPDEQPYHMLSDGGQLFAGLAADEGLPRWTSWVQVPDVDAIAGQTMDRGGLVVIPAREHLVGRVIEVAGPGQARLTLVQLNIRQPYVSLPPIQRHFGQTRDGDRVKDFYQDLTGWTLEQKSADKPIFDVVMADHTIATLTLSGEDDVADASWLPCITVKDVRKTLARAVAAGGKQILHPTKRENLGMSARVADSQGAEFWLVQQ